jgi:hemoglobin
MHKRLYDQLGGFAFVRKLVSDFYDRVLDEDELAPFFEKTDMARLVDHQTKFWATALGGPASYTDEQLEAVHRGMGITSAHFDLVLELVAETLEDHDVSEQHVAEIGAAFAGYRAVIVGGAGGDG